MADMTQSLEGLKADWNRWGEKDPLWAILSANHKQGNKWDVSEFFAAGRKEVDGIMEHLRALGVRPLPSHMALDFGCGVGRLTQALAGYCQTVYGVDIADSMLKLAEQYNRYGERCKYRVNTVNNLSLFPADNFDFIYSALVLQHMEPRFAKNYISEFLRTLAPGGACVFQFLGERKGLNALVKQLLPKLFLDMYYRVKLGGPPTILIYGLDPQEINRLIEANKAKVINRERTVTDSGWVSYVYYVIKPMTTIKLRQPIQVL